jgi:hypothetical protein|tara:strand:- start:302 stop:472 length:171 start_codon:yes stop_codon:yes gene_type:complete
MATGQTHGGKGSSARPVDKKKFDSNFDAIFKKTFAEHKDYKEKEKKDVPTDSNGKP